MAVQTRCVIESSVQVIPVTEYLSFVNLEIIALTVLPKLGKFVSQIYRPRRSDLRLRDSTGESGQPCSIITAD